jgi:hypothetical protein
VCAVGSLQQIQDKIDALKTTLDEGLLDIRGRLLYFQTSQENRDRRTWNGMNALGSHILKPLAREYGSVGDMPPTGLFPETRADLDSLTLAQIEALARFYGQRFSGTKEAQLLQLRIYIGA